MVIAGFLDQPGICLIPSFYMPETDALKWSTHNGIRKTLFFSAFRNVKYIEYKRLKNEEEYFELKSIEPWDQGFIDKFIDTYIGGELKTAKLIQT